ncbi:MAG: leucine-rich repeat domain-containing protein [Clostridia bacterium]|nr:leucine-rich repeat domain-containing protein [Clostridia bacterium]
MKKIITCFLFTSLICAIMCVTLLASCNKKCADHIDENGDGVCDACSFEYELVFKLTADESGYELDRVGPGYRGGDVVIPAKYQGLPVVEIGYDAFESEYKLTSVDIPDSVVSIDGDAFESQTALTSVNVGKGVVTIGVSAFENCTNLKTVVISDATEYIYASAFEGCTSLERVSLGKNVKEITGSVFENCTSLKTIWVPASIEKMGSWVFNGNNMTNIYFGVAAPGENWNEKWAEGLNEGASIYWTSAGKIKLSDILQRLSYGYNVEGLIEEYDFYDGKYYLADNSEDYCKLLSDIGVPYEGPFDTLFEGKVMLCYLRCVSGSADFIPVDYFYDVNTNKIECKTVYQPEPDVNFPAVEICWCVDLLEVPRELLEHLS